MDTPAEQQPTPKTSPPITLTKLRKDIEQLKSCITKKHENRKAEMKSNPRLLSLDKEIALHTKHLFMLEDNLTKAEEEAKKLAQDSFKDIMRNGLAEESADDAYIPDIHKFQLMKKWLDTNQSLLLRSPPGSGKTSFAVQFLNYLSDHCFTVYYLNASWSENQVNDERSMETIFQERFHLTFTEICAKSHESSPVYLIIDDAQAWYLSDMVLGKAKRDVASFWYSVKANKSVSYTMKLLHSASKSTLVNVRLLCLAEYGEPGYGEIPLAFMNPEDPVTGRMSLLGLDFLRLDRKMTSELIKRYIELQGKRTSFLVDPTICDWIYTETNGHAGAIRALLSLAIRANKRTREDVLELTRCTDLNVYRALKSVDVNTIQNLSPSEMTHLIGCIISFKQGKREFPMRERDALRLIKLGLFAQKTGTTLSGETKIAFPSPLHFDLALYNVLHRPVELRQSRDCFEQVIKEMVIRMSPKVLRDTTPGGHHPHELEWQDECRNSFRSMSDATLKINVGRELDERAYLDMYIDDGFQWGIELVRLGGDKRFEECVGSQFRTLPMQQHAILYFTNEVPSLAALYMHDDVWYLVYNDMYTKVVVYQSGSILSAEWDLIGYQACTE